ncbi:MAG: AmmeMemoRadiSam system protein B [Thaumarchaeota archaeon]|nr:AmmeMemoRadiSam system protein B [Nitrososphaerota archaeon]
MIRKPAVAGSFYPSDRERLRAAIRKCYEGPVGPGQLPPAARRGATAVAFVAPHAGYEYSGPVAAHSYLHASSFASPDLIVIAAPNHYGIGSGVSTFGEGSWETPLGTLQVDAAASEQLADHAGVVSFDPDAHSLEHSLEVQLPFLQEIYGNSVPLLPVSLLFQDIETATAVGRAIGKVAQGRRAVLIASSDLTHYEPYEQARTKDLAVLERVVSLDVEGMYESLEMLRVTACGYGPIAAVMTAAVELGMKKGELLKYANSGDTGGDRSSVVGYGSVRFV